MHCIKCGGNNEKGSKFCITCGDGLDKQNNLATTDEVLFVPEKKSNTARNIIITTLIISIIFVVLLASANSSNSESNPMSNTSTKVNTAFPISYLSIKNLNPEWVGDVFYLTGTLINNYSTPASNILLRIDFYGDKEEKQLFDTRYITISGVSNDGAYSFREPVYKLNYRGIPNYWYTVVVISSE